jgi:methylmalonyl-CoA mutase
MADPTTGTEASGTAPLALRATFPPVDTRDWDALARADLKGQDYDKRLLWRTDEGLTVKPFYRREDLDGLEALTSAIPDGASLRGDDAPWQAVEAPAWPADAIRADLLHDAGATAVQELAWAVAEGIDRLAVATDAGTPVDEAAGTLAFVFAVGSTYFTEIAKLRAARLLWGTAVAAFGPTDPASGAMRVHVRTARANKGTYDPYTNLLRATTEAMSAAIGGADTLLVEPHGYEPHLAINVQRILAEEAHLDAVADPAAGSYYVESLTDALAREAWAQVQQIEQAGGYTAARAAGQLDAHLTTARAAREKAVSSRRRTLVGVNNYPDLTEHAPSAGPFPVPEAPDGLAPLRLAAPFESMRERTARHAAATGRTPDVHLLTRGDVRMRMARANFCLNFFGCAGLAITQGPDVPADADLVVLCSADAEYVALAQDVVPSTRVPVLVAGNPKDVVEALTAAGVQGFVHVQSDAVATLTQWQDRLGMAK